jgi:hypothetical protein
MLLPARERRPVEVEDAIVVSDTVVGTERLIVLR